MDLKLLSLFLILTCLTAIKCWVELDIAGNDLSAPNPKFVKPEEACDESEEGVGGGQSKQPQGRSLGKKHRKIKRRRKGRLPRPDRRKAFREVNNFAQDIENGVADPKAESPDTDLDSDPNEETSQSPEEDPNPDDQQDSQTEEDCVQTTTVRTEISSKPRLRMIKSKQETQKENVRRQTMETTECTEIIDMEPKTSVKIETYTVPYTENIVKYKTVTRKIVYIQRRRKIKRTLNKPILVIKRKVVKDRQFFERIIPKVIETREIINKPKIDYKVIEGPMEEMGGEKPIEQEEDCDESDTMPPAPEDLIGGMPNRRSGMFPGGTTECPPGMNPNSGEHPYVSSGGGSQGPNPDYGAYNSPPSQDIHVGFDFNSALNAGLNAAFSSGNDGVVPPNMRSGMLPRGITTECPPGMINNGLGPNSGGQAGGYGQPGGSNIYAVPRTNAYGQPVLSFQRRK